MELFKIGVSYLSNYTAYFVSATDCGVAVQFCRIGQARAGLLRVPKSFHYIDRLSPLKAACQEGCFVAPTTETLPVAPIHSS